MSISMLKHPSAFLPPLMSLIVLVAGLLEGMSTGFVRQTDEGTAAHLFQILMPLQVLIIAYFVIKYFPQNSKQAIWILALQVFCAMLVIAPVFLLKL